jgi:dolichol-phosphate mannosyltransferase
MTARVGVVMPTYNEADNIAEALTRLSALPLADLLVVVVDDGSPDGTADLAEKSAAMWPAGRELRVLRRSAKTGLGRAYVAGMSGALEAGCGIVVQMDADLSHPVDTIPRMLEGIASGAQVVIGSRYAPGGELDADWPLRRQLLSHAANFYVSVLLRLSLSDVTAGFVAWQADTLRRVDLSTIDSNGYAFQVEMKWRARRLGATFIEVPIAFSERTAGQSKMSLAVKVEGLLLPWKLLFTRYRS